MSNLDSHTQHDDSSKVETASHQRHLFYIYLLIDWGLEKETKVYPRFLIEKRIKFFSILLPAFSLIIWVMTSPNNFEKITILNI